MILHAEEDDRFAVLRLMRDSAMAAGLDDGRGAAGFRVPFDAAWAERLVLGHIRDPEQLCLLHVHDGEAAGLLMARSYMHPFGPVRIASETLWWLDPAARGGRAAYAMLGAYERWAAERGCAYAGMAGMGADPAVGPLYLRRGYRLAETHYLKAL